MNDSHKIRKTLHFFQPETEKELGVCAGEVLFSLQTNTQAKWVFVANTLGQIGWVWVGERCGWADGTSDSSIKEVF